MKKELGIFILLVALCVFASLHPAWHFLTLYNLQNTARLVGMFGILGIAGGLVIIAGGIDLSVGSVLALEGVLLAMMLVDHQWPWPVAVLAVLAGAVLLGAFHGFVVTKVGMQPFILTLCGLLVYRSLARQLSADANMGFGDSDYGSLRQLATGSFCNVPMPFIIFVVIALVMWVLLHRSAYGRYLFAVGRNEEAWRDSGINSALVIASSYVLCTLLTAIAGVIFALDINSIQGTDFGLSYELYAIAAAVLGGCSLRGGEGSILGIAIGTALLQVIQNVAELMGIPSPLSGALMGAIIFFGVLVDLVLAKRKKGRRGQIVAGEALNARGTAKF